MANFHDSVNNLPLPDSGDLRELPLTHVTDWLRATPVLESGSINPPDSCPVYKEALVYAFYGRAAYVPNGGQQVVFDLPCAPVCFVFDAQTAPVHRLLPFDSGGIDRYAPPLHHKCSRKEFEMPPGIDSARRLIGHFYGGNRAYFRDRPQSGVTVNPLNATMLSYYNLISSPAQADERKSAIEVQFAAPLHLAGHLKAVVLPEDTLGSPEVRALLNGLDAQPIPYWLPQTYSPFEFRGQLRTYLEKLFTDLGVLP